MEEKQSITRIIAIILGIILVGTMIVSFVL
ncbi:hypothetical protein C815_00167 [Firmicutes bacterium M10-2]|nr:hypothetical protein C815_00167 [Firmicutes bacterium M10-2]